MEVLVCWVLLQYAWYSLVRAPCCMPAPMAGPTMTPPPGPALVTRPPIAGPVYCPGASVRKLLQQAHRCVMCYLYQDFLSFSIDSSKYFKVKYS